MNIYLDNAATTAMHPAVVEKMYETLKNVYGNPSAVHGAGRKAKAELELSRKKIAEILGCNSTEIIFTASGTEADNMALRCAVRDLGVRTIISTEIEHKAVLDTAKHLQATQGVIVKYVNLDSYGKVIYEHLAQLANEHKGALISLMHANNEIGTLHDLDQISKIARENECYFHSDTVQTMGHFPLNLKTLDIDFLVCSAHKFHGPKGVGFLYKNKGLRIGALQTGGGQEKNLRPGTENVAGILGLAEALSLATENLASDMAHIYAIKKYFMEQLGAAIPGVEFNGDTSEQGGLATVLNVSFPPVKGADTLLFLLDIAGIYCAGGSACNSGAVGGSHVIEALQRDPSRTNIRFSFCKANTKEEIDKVMEELVKLLAE